MAKVSFKSDTLSASYDVRKRGSSGHFITHNFMHELPRRESAM
jgi:hypothetical protein